MPADLVTILGPTASGKTGLAAKLAYEFNGEIISADSRQVYRRMDIGTGKDLDDYKLSGIQVPYHLIDIIEPSDEFNLFEFQNKFYKVYENITGRQKLPFLVGGTGLYLSSVVQRYKLSQADFSSPRAEVLKSYDVEGLRQILLSKKTDVHNKSDLTDKNRLIRAILVEEAETNPANEFPEINSLVIGIRAERELIKKRITERLEKRLREGMVEEVQNLISSGVTHERLEQFGLEYRYITLYLKGDLNYNEMFRKLNSAIHNFAKRQMTWFRKMEREGVKIHWIELREYSKAKKIIQDNINA
jgi:tRNA dimethylallyltransferase